MIQGKAFISPGKRKDGPDAGPEKGRTATALAMVLGYTIALMIKKEYCYKVVADASASNLLEDQYRDLFMATGTISAHVRNLDARPIRDWSSVIQEILDIEPRVQLGGLSDSEMIEFLISDHKALLLRMRGTARQATRQQETKVSDLVTNRINQHQIAVAQLQKALRA